MTINLSSDPGREWRHVALIGMMGAGKTTIGKALAEAMEWKFVDSDDAIIARTGYSVSEFFAQKGEKAFREEESGALARVLSGADPTVLATGGGCVEREFNRELLAAHSVVVWLRASIDTLVERVGTDTSRPLLQGDASAKLFEILQRRAHLYALCADVVVDVDDRTVDSVVLEIAAWVRAQPWSEANG